MAEILRLGINIDHSATIRNARGGNWPDPVKVAQEAIKGGADSITAHLREDRRHIKDEDMKRLRELPVGLNFEMAATSEMLSIVLGIKPFAVCLVPERRQELTTEGGLNTFQEAIPEFIAKLKEAKIRTSLFVDPDLKQLKHAAELKADAVELHTGAYAQAKTEEALKQELLRLKEGAKFAKAHGLEVHAGHGLTYDNVEEIGAMTEISELNIGHYLIGEALFVGLAKAVSEMRRKMNLQRK
ncbi:pyridoxine 5'-phosphate synthase [Acetobacteraceae bacterium]|nr:pyridoxine 5'-phosphate synthase [Acetobacteraceae bacterium]